MIVFNLSCEAEHRFEGWFGSAENFDAQSTRGHVACPVCGSTQVRKQLSAPRLNLSGQTALPEMQASTSVAVLDPTQRQLQALIKSVLESTENVGVKFAEEARRIHYNEAPARAIRGVASHDDARALVDEGIEVAYLPVPVVDKSQLN